MLVAAEPSWDVRSAHDGAEALAVVQEEAIDVVLTDLDMPGLNGLALLVQLRRSRPDTVRILHSSQPEMAESHLVDHVLPKPAASATVLATLRWAVRSARASRLSALVAALGR